MYPHQTDRLAEVLSRAGIGALVATAAENVAYVSGWMRLGSKGCDVGAYAIYSPRGTALVVPAIDVPAAVDQRLDVDHIVCHGDAPITYSPATSIDTQRVREILSASSPTRWQALAAARQLIGHDGALAGIDESRLDPPSWREIGAALGMREPIAAAGLFASARRVKAPFEIECLERALHIAEEALDAVIQVLERGMTEREAATLYAQEVVKRGATPAAAFVAMGERTAIPYPRPSDRALRSGDVVRLDVRAHHRGYCASVARTAVYGEPSPAMESTYLALQSGIEAAVTAARPGAPPGRVVDAAIEAVRAEGLGGYACREIGHGIGLAEVEAPSLGASDDAAIGAGEVLCVSVPRYELGSFGILVRDTILITTAGGRAMNRSRRDLIVLD